MPAAVALTDLNVLSVSQQSNTPTPKFCQEVEAKVCSGTPEFQVYQRKTQEQQVGVRAPGPRCLLRLQSHKVPTGAASHVLRQRHRKRVGGFRTQVKQK